jgi:hypothetical protein
VWGFAALVVAVLIGQLLQMATMWLIVPLWFGVLLLPTLLSAAWKSVTGRQAVPSSRRV